MRFITPDGNMYTGRSYDDIVQQMAGDKLTEPASLDAYRRSTALRASEMFGTVVDPTDSRSFILGLEEAGLLERSG